ncbi:MAG: MFS transporter [Acidimicrobiales bacterium]
MYTGLGVRPAESADKRSRRGAVNGTVLALGATSFFTDISSEMVAAVVPLFLTIELGFSRAAFGLFQGVYELANALLRLVGGAIADRTRRPKETAAAGYGLSTLTRAGLVGSALTGLPAVPFLIADRFGKGLRTGPRDAMISLATPEAAWGTAFGIHRTMDAAGALIGPILAFAILFAVPGSFDSIFVLSFGFGMVGFAVIATKVRNPVFTTAAPPVRVPSAIRNHAKNQGFRRILAMGFVVSIFTVADSLAYLVIWDASKAASTIGTEGFGLEWFPLLFAGTAMAFLVTATPLGRLADRIGRARMWVIGHGFLLGVYAVLLTGPTSTLAVLAVLVLLGSYYGATDGVLPALAAGVIPEDVRSGGLALLSTIVATGRMVSAVGFGLIWDRAGADIALLTAAVGLIVVLVITATRAIFRTPEVL